MSFPFQTFNHGLGQANQQASNPNSVPHDPRALVLHLQYLQRLEMLRQQAAVASLCPSVPASLVLSTKNVAFVPQPPSAFASHSRVVGSADAIVAAVAEKIAVDAAIAACLRDLQNQRRRLLLNNDLNSTTSQDGKPRSSEENPSSTEPSSANQAFSLERKSSSTRTQEGKPKSKEEKALSTKPPPATQTVPSERDSLKFSESPPSLCSAIKVLKTLGTTLRSKTDKFIDVSRFPIIESSGSEKRRGASVFFPEILYRMLIEAEEKDLTDIISFLPHGRAFRLQNKYRFEQELLPRYFLGQTKKSSFTRQLNMYGILRISTGTDYGAYYHELLIRGRPDLINFMRRVGKPYGVDRRKIKLPEGEDPNLYDLPSIPQLDHHRHHHHPNQTKNK